MPSLFANRQSAVTIWLASVSGFSEASAASLLSLATPAVLRVMGRQRHDADVAFTAESLGHLLASQGPFLSAAAPAGLTQALGLLSFGDAGSDCMTIATTPSGDREGMSRKGVAPPVSLVLYDGVCHLCQGLVRFIVERDPSARFAFAPLQSPVARRWVPGGIAEGPGSVVLVEGGVVYTKSTAALRIARRLGFPWALAYAMVVLPRAVRDTVYDWVARHRYRWFGRSDVCDRLRPDVMARMVDDAFERHSGAGR